MRVKSIGRVFFRKAMAVVLAFLLAFSIFPSLNMKVHAGTPTTATATASTAVTAGENNTVTLTVLDENGIVDTSFSGTKDILVTGYAAAPNGSVGSFGGQSLAGPGILSVTNFNHGVGTANLRLNSAGRQTIGFNIEGVAAPDTNPIEVTVAPGVVTQMKVTREPVAPTYNCEEFAVQPIVTLLDVFGNICTQINGTPVTMTKADGGAWSLVGTATVSSISGIVNFSGLKPRNQGYVYGACMLVTSGSLPMVTTAPIPLPTPTDMMSLEASVVNTTPVAGVDNTITLKIKRSYGDDFQYGNGTYTITVSGYQAAPNGSLGYANSTLLTGTSVGVPVTFNLGEGTINLKLNKAGSQTVNFRMAGLVHETSNDLVITPVSGVATAMSVIQDITAPTVNGGVFAQQPKITVVDVYGNICNNLNGTIITASKKDGGNWTLAGTPTASTIAGVATFSGLGATNSALVNNVQLAFNGEGLTEITSGTVVLPAPVILPHYTVIADVAYLTPSVGQSNKMFFRVEDSSRNVDTSYSGSKMLLISGVEEAPDGSCGSLDSTPLEASTSRINLTFLNGRAVAHLKLNKADQQNIGFNLEGVDNPNTYSFRITPKHESASLLSIVQDITAPTANGGAFAQQPKIAVTDLYGNLCSDINGTTITASKKDSGSWSLTGTTTAATIAGIATFSQLGATNATLVGTAQLALMGVHWRK